MVGWARQRSASSRMVAAGMPVMPSAHSGVLSASVGSSFSQPTQWVARKTRSSRPRLTMCRIIDRISAVSVLGRIGTNSAASASSVSAR